VPPRRDPSIRDGLLFRLIYAANLLSRPFVERVGAREGLTLSEWRSLIALSAEPGLSGEDVARATGQDKMTVSRSLRALETKGWVQRTVDARDLKRNCWQMTSSGWTVFDRVADLARERQRHVLDRLPARDRAELQRLLGIVVASLSDDDT
jgi:DNA-binding MarR family transcriptional regulator